ncbi:cohesin domain-containing protein, partial [Ruminococcus sp.]|uniref:cohesin domain-containing protein n=1 Tax=Ruminococcus sp. TaxID=41978 RepID=UPI003FD8B3BD
EMFTVKFKVSDNATDGTYPITLTYEDGDITNQTFDNINPKIINGAVTLTKVKKGDIYEDGVVNTKDGVKLSQVLAKWDNVTLSSEISASADGIAVSIPNIDTNAGEYVDVPVTLSKNSGIAGFNFNINYDTSALTPVSITAGDILSDGTFTSNLLQDINLSHLECVTA